MVELPKGVNVATVKGRRYFYYHPARGTKNAGRPIRLPDDPRSPEFWAEYARVSGKSVQDDAPRFGTFDALIAGYRASPEFARKAQRTQELDNWHLKIIKDIWGPRLVKGVRPRHVLELRDAFANTPRKADQLVTMLSVLVSWGIPREYADINPCREIGKLFHSDGWAPWSWPDITHAKDHLPPHLWWVAALALYTGQRQSDVLDMNWSAIIGGGIEARQSKTGKALWLPLHRDLRPILDAIPKVSTRILTNSRSLPWSSGFKAAWQKQMNRSAFAAFRERTLVFHGLRKSAVVMLLEAGCTDAEVAAITGQSRDMVAHYSLMVNQKKLAAAAILKWENSNEP